MPRMGGVMIAGHKNLKKKNPPTEDLAEFGNFEPTQA
jgi:hypothetical protein